MSAKLPNFPPVGASRRFLVYADNNPMAGFDTFASAKDAANMYKKPGDPKRKSESAGEKCNWTVRDTQNNSVVYTAPSQRKS